MTPQGRLIMDTAQDNTTPTLGTLLRVWTGIGLQSFGGGASTLLLIRRAFVEKRSWIGADEMNRKKGHNYITVFADLVNKRVLFGTEGKDASVWEHFAQQFEAHNGHPKSVRQVAIDMSRAYIKGARENFGNAQLVFDKFHVIQEANEGVEKVRRLGTQQDELKGQQLAKSQWIFRKNPESHTERELERMEQMDWKHLMTVLAYQMRLILQDIYKGNQQTYVGI